MARIARTKAELKRAVADKTEEIVIAPELTETVGWIVDAVRLPWEKRVALLCFFGAGLISLLFLPMPEYAEGFLAALLSVWIIAFKAIIGTLIVAAVVFVFSVVSGISWMLILFVLIQALFFGVITAVKMLCTYDVVDAGVKTASGGNNGQNAYGLGVRLRYRKK